MIAVLIVMLFMVYYTDVLFDGVKGNFKKIYFVPLGKWVIVIKDFLKNLGGDKW